MSAVRAELPAIDDGLPRKQAEYWRETLADAPEPLELLELLELPADHPRPAQPDPAVALVGLELDEEFFTALKALACRHGANIFTVLLAGWAAVLSRASS